MDNNEWKGLHTRIRDAICKLDENGRIDEALQNFKEEGLTPEEKTKFSRDYLKKLIENIKKEKEIETKLNQGENMYDLLKGGIYHAIYTSGDLNDQGGWIEKWKNSYDNYLKSGGGQLYHTTLPNFPCAEKDCVERATQGAHVFHSDQTTWDSWLICYIIPTCDLHNLRPSENPNNYPMEEEISPQFDYFKEDILPCKIPLKEKEEWKKMKKEDLKKEGITWIEDENKKKGDLHKRDPGYYRLGMPIKPDSYAMKHLINLSSGAKVTLIYSHQNPHDSFLLRLLLTL